MSLLKQFRHLCHWWSPRHPFQRSWASTLFSSWTCSTFVWILITDTHCHTQEWTTVWHIFGHEKFKLWAGLKALNSLMPFTVASVWNQPMFSSAVLHTCFMQNRLWRGTGGKKSIRREGEKEVMCNTTLLPPQCLRIKMGRGVNRCNASLTAGGKVTWQCP